MSMWLCQVIRQSWRLGILSINLNGLSGRFNPNPSPNSVTQCKKDTSTNGSRVCSSLVPNNCQGGFRLGGNCNGQQRLDITRLPPSEFQMGDDQVSGDLENAKFIQFIPGQQRRYEVCSPQSAAGKYEYAVQYQERMLQKCKLYY